MDSLEYLLEHISEEDHLQDTVVDGRKKLIRLALLGLGQKSGGPSSM